MNDLKSKDAHSKEDADKGTFDRKSIDIYSQTTSRTRQYHVIGASVSRVVAVVWRE